MKPSLGDIVIKEGKWGRKDLKYRITHYTSLDNGLEFYDGIRVKWDKINKQWVSFGKEKGLWKSSIRLFIEDDFHYLK